MVMRGFVTAWLHCNSDTPEYCIILHSIELSTLYTVSTNFEVMQCAAVGQTPWEHAFHQSYTDLQYSIVLGASSVKASMQKPNLTPTVT